jgi:hypothetical protein
MLDSMRRLIIKQPKMPMSQVILAELLICIVTVAVVRPSAGARWGGDLRAYIDPGTGSFILQVLVASLAGVVYIIKMFWRNIKGYFLKLLHKKKGDEKD